MMTKELVKNQLSDSTEQTEKIGSIIGARLRGGECFELVSDLGGGKTAFTRGLVAGSGSISNVASPTFTISKQYSSDQFVFYHFDFYRLDEPGLVAEELREALQDKKSVVIVEWAQTVLQVLPDQRIKVIINKLADDFGSRELVFHYSEKHAYLFGDSK